MNNSVTIISFSPRKDGNCAKIAEKIAEFHNRTNVRSYQITAENFLPCNGCNYECLSRGAVCPAKTPYQAEVMESAYNSDIVYYIVPNFCGYPNANCFAFSERSVGYFAGNQEIMNRYMSVTKRFIIVSNTESDNFRNAMQHQTKEEPKMLYLKTGKYKKRSTAGDLMESEEAQADLRAFLEE